MLCQISPFLQDRTEAERESVGKRLVLRMLKCMEHNATQMLMMTGKRKRYPLLNVTASFSSSVVDFLIYR